MKCFVTGATGFVGGHLCERLAREGHEVYALARRSSKRDLLESVGARIVEGDVHSTNVFARHAEQIDVFFHLAAITKAVRPSQFFEINADGTESIARGLKRGAFRGRVVLLSSLAAGGPATDATTPRKETDADKPVSDYGTSKLEGEKRLQRLLPEDAGWVVLRPGAIYGPREHEIYEVIKVLNRFGTAIRFGQGVHAQMTHVEDVVEGLIRAGFADEAAGKTFYLNDDAVWSFEALISLIAESLGRPVRVIGAPLFAGRGLAWLLDMAGIVARRPLSPLGRDKVHELEAKFWIGDSSLARKELSWEPRWNFPDGLRETIEWYRANKWL